MADLIRHSCQGKLLHLLGSSTRGIHTLRFEISNLLSRLHGDFTEPETEEAHCYPGKVQTNFWYAGFSDQCIGHRPRECRDLLNELSILDSSGILSFFSYVLKGHQMCRYRGGCKWTCRAVDFRPTETVYDLLKEYWILSGSWPPQYLM